MTAHQLRLVQPPPFFAEVPYYVWGEVNYDSDGDCDRPTDRNWSWLELTNRNTRERLTITCQADVWTVEGNELAAARAALFLTSRCGGEWPSPRPAEPLRDWPHEKASARASRVQAEFERPELRPFDVGHYFWGSWKWIGWFSTDFTWVGRWIMHSVVTGDRRAVCLCAEWLRAGTVGEPQSQALRYALSRLTERFFATDREWAEWYFQGNGSEEFPEPDFQQWHADLKRQIVLE
jgi:hypothetical protein